ncbi:hypothetical protein D3874_15055 [Oleomonas cavernae]|uniref:DNA-binding protein n=1 Tax=Oleomonas cavernae TaxID=2320859 RepID=A0A418WDT5_9PROT|nr:hypothetical protein D3874_15055 [Oleomonas cavernae]
MSTLLREREGGREVSVVTSAGEQVALTPALLDLLAQAAGIMADGADVAVFAHEVLLTSQQAADLLNVSRQYMVRLLERGISLRARLARIGASVPKTWRTIDSAETKDVMRLSRR